VAASRDDSASRRLWRPSRIAQCPPARAGDGHLVTESGEIVGPVPVPGITYPSAWSTA